MGDISQIPTCPVCMETIESIDNAKLCCRHDLHLSCVLELHTPTCPICRTRLKSDKLCEDDLRKMEIKHNEDLENFDEDPEDGVFGVEDLSEEERYLSDLRWERELWRAFCETVGRMFKEKAKDFIKETGLEDVIRLGRTDDGAPAELVFPRESKFLAYLRLFGGVDDFETRRKIFALMDGGDYALVSFLRDKPLAVDENFLHELGYQIYLTASGEEDNIDLRCEAFEWTRGDIRVPFIRHFFTH